MKTYSEAIREEAFAVESREFAGMTVIVSMDRLYLIGSIYGIDDIEKIKEDLWAEYNAPGFYEECRRRHGYTGC